MLYETIKINPRLIIVSAYIIIFLCVVKKGDKISQNWEDCEKQLRSKHENYDSMRETLSCIGKILQFGYFFRKIDIPEFVINETL